MGCDPAPSSLATRFARFICRGGTPLICARPNSEPRLASWLLATALTYSLATGCHSGTHPRDIRSVQVTLERTPCYGVCPVYTVTPPSERRPPPHLLSAQACDLHWQTERRHPWTTNAHRQAWQFERPAENSR